MRDFHTLPAALLQDALLCEFLFLADHAQGKNNEDKTGEYDGNQEEENLLAMAGGLRWGARTGCGVDIITP
jgi:hypothetical protein